jgi:FOG: EAL domain
VIEEALAALARWTAKALLPEGFALGVNLSVRQFREEGFCGEVGEALVRHGVDPSRIFFEITESLLIDGPDSVGRTIDALRALGVAFSIDDFGTGYSSLSYLRKLPVDQIKIDRSFVKDLDTSGGDRTIVATIVVLARALSLEVVAEGVETAEQKKILEEMGCERFQGYLFGRPVPEEEFVVRLARMVLWKKRDEGTRCHGRGSLDGGTGRE